MLRKLLILLIVGIALVMIVTVLFENSPLNSAVKYYGQVTMERVRADVDLQPVVQKGATYVGSKACAECHQEIFHVQQNSMHPKMIQDVKANPSVIVADFSTLPEDASFKREEIVYTIGSKFKQRFMIRKDTPNKEGYPEENYIIGNYQWNTETQKWQGYTPLKDWYHDAWPDDQSMAFTSHTCDGCHFTGFNSQYQRVEPGINCENCHGPGSQHVADGLKDSIYLATDHDPQRAMEVCIQCHMRNVDKRLDDPNVEVKDLYEEARDYPYGYEPGMALAKYKKPSALSVDSSKFYSNGIGKKNRMQGNDYIHSTMYKHGITCMNCHEMIRNDSEKLITVLESHATGMPVAWTRIHDLPDFVYFDHSAHVSRGVGCVSCHGRVDKMEVVSHEELLSMGWCLRCHRHPEEHLRPVEHVTQLDWEPTVDQIELGKQLMEARGIQPSEDCSTCHR